MEPTGEAPTPTGGRSNYDLNFISVREDEFADPVMPGGAASGGASASGQRAVQNNRRAELYEAEAKQSNLTLPKFYSIRLDTALCRSINPFAVQQKVTKLCGSPPERLETEGKSTYCVKIKTGEQARKLLTLTDIEGKSCKVEPHSHRNSSKGLVFIKEFDVDDVTLLKDYLREFDVIAVEPAPFIKTKSKTTKAFILTFNSPKTPYSIYIPGERSDTQVQPFKNRPMMCQKCLTYGHTQKRCRSEISSCRCCCSCRQVLGLGVWGGPQCSAGGGSGGGLGGRLSHWGRDSNAPSVLRKSAASRGSVHKLTGVRVVGAAVQAKMCSVV